MKILVTGACGVVGAAVLKQGLERHHQIGILTHSMAASSYAFQVKDQISVHHRMPGWEKDLIDIIRSYDVVINLDGDASSAPEHEEERTQRNFVLPKMLYEILHDRQHFIHCSTSAVLSDGHQNRPVTELDWGKIRDSDYARSKLRFDQWLLENEKLPTSVLHPGYVLGEWDARPSSGVIFLKMLLGQITTYVNRPKNFISSIDLANFILTVAEKKVTGRFVVGGENVMLHDFFEVSAKLLKIAPLQEMTDLESLETYAKEFCASDALLSEKAKNVGLQITVGQEQMIRESLESLAKKKLIRFKSE